MENLENRTKANFLKKAWEAIARFYEDMKVPKEIRQEGRDAIEFYKNVEVPSYVRRLGKEGVREYKETRTILNTRPSIKNTYELEMMLGF